MSPEHLPVPTPTFAIRMAIFHMRVSRFIRMDWIKAIDRPRLHQVSAILYRDRLASNRAALPAKFSRCLPCGIATGIATAW